MDESRCPLENEQIQGLDYHRELYLYHNLYVMYIVTILLYGGGCYCRYLSVKNSGVNDFKSG